MSLQRRHVHTATPDAERIAITMRISRLGLGDRLIMRDGGNLWWDVAKGVTFGVQQQRRVITWEQARRIADGEDWERVVWSHPNRSASNAGFSDVLASRASHDGLGDAHQITHP